MNEADSYSDSSERQAQRLVLDEDDDDPDNENKSGSSHGGTGRHVLQLASTIAVKSEVFCLAFSEDGRFLLACCGDGLVRVFNPNSGATISVLTSSSSSKKLPRASSGSNDKKHRLEHGGGGDAGVGYDIRRRRDSRIRTSSDSLYATESAPAAVTTVEASSVEKAEMRLPCTCAVFRPRGKLREKTSGVALIGYSEGEVQLWHVPSAKLLYKQVLSIQQDVDDDAYSQATALHQTRPSFTSPERASSSQSPLGVEVLCVAYSGEGDRFAVGASDGVIRIHDDDTNKALVAELKPGVGRGAGHSSRIFSVKFHPDDVNMLVSGGWDNCVHIWDVSRGITTRTIFGPHVCGDAIGVMGRTILTGSWRDDAQLEAWNIDTGKREGSAFWSGFGGGSGKAVALQGTGIARRCRLYAALFGGPEGFEGRFVAAGGGDGANEVKVFDVHNERRLVGSLLGLSAGAISLAFGDWGERLAVGLANGLIHLVDIIPSTFSPNTGILSENTETATNKASQRQHGGHTIMF